MCSRLRGAETREWAGPRPLGRLWKEEVLPAPSSLGLRLPGVQSRVVVWPPPRLCGKEEGPHLSGVRTPVLASRTPWPAWGHGPRGSSHCSHPAKTSLRTRSHPQVWDSGAAVFGAVVCLTPQWAPFSLYGPVPATAAASLSLSPPWQDGVPGRPCHRVI